jgi:predicted acylesterase/phospholipase RssA
VELRLALRASASLPFLAGPPVELGGRRFYDAGVAESIPFRTPLAQGATHVLLLRSRRPLTPELVDPQADDLADLDESAAEENVPSGNDPNGPPAAANGPSASLRNGRPASAPNGLAADDPNGSPDPNGPNGAKPPRVPRSSRILARTALRRESLELRTALLTRPVRTAADVVRIMVHEAEGKALMIFPPPSVPPVSRLTTDPKLRAAGLESGRQAVRDIFGR